MPGTTQVVGGYKAISASGNVSPRAVSMLGVFCSSSTAGTLAVYDDSAVGTGTVAVAVFSLVAGTFYQIPISMINGINCVVGGAASITVVFA